MNRVNAREEHAGAAAVEAEQGTLFAVEVEGPFAGVVVNRPVDQVLTYSIPAPWRKRLQPGQRVRVPLGRGNQPAIGYCVRIDERAEIQAGKLKEIVEVLDDPPLVDAAMLRLTRWLADYYACSWGQALDAAVPAGVKKQAGTRLHTCVVVPEEVRMRRDTLDLPDKQAAVLALVCRSEIPLTVGDVCRLAKVTPATLGTLRKKGLVHTVKRRLGRVSLPEPERDPSDDGRAPAALTDEQTRALQAMGPALDEKRFSTFLLHGVTGSGKTEVYLSAIERVVAAGREAIVLVPEISLTPQTIRRFRRRFERVAVLHSHLSDVERHHHWQSIARGEVQVVVGARSAIFAPTRRLGLIVVDEEHESTFKQESIPRYHARDVAVMRGRLEGVPVVLGSATPSLESWRNAQAGRYQRLALEYRVAQRPMPEVGIIDLRHEKPAPGRAAGALSGALRAAMTDAVDEGGQVILLLNRRGFHTFILCPRCGAVLKCDACDVALTYHRSRHLAVCHLCDAERDPPQRCPDCQKPGLHYGGIGTERLEREVKEAFPERVVRRMDSDTMKAPGSHEKVLSAFRDGQIDILLGTQMIAKGLDFPNVTLVGVVNADTALHLPDFRAAERTFQLVAQVAGRTGRGERPGRVVVQTYAPEAPAITCAARHDYESFVATELVIREQGGYPPYGRLVRLVARGPEEVATRSALASLVESIRRAAPPSEVRILGPAPAPVERIKNLFRFHALLRASTSKPLQAILNEVVPQALLPHPIELAVDVDPVSLL